VVSRAGLDPVEYRKTSAGDLTSAVQTIDIVIPTELSRLLKTLRTAEENSVKLQV
jgi:hypothetical protein